MNYYYFASSLPMLSMDTPPSISHEQFCQLCEEQLKQSDFDTLQEFLDFDSDEPKSSFVQNWRNRETQLRNAITKIRADRTKRDSLQYTREHDDFDPQIEKTVTEAFSKNNPADRELTLDKFRWSQIEDLAGCDTFSIDAILAYSMKLQIAERWTKMDDEKGAENANKIIDKRSDDKPETSLVKGQ